MRLLRPSAAVLALAAMLSSAAANPPPTSAEAPRVLNPATAAPAPPVASSPYAPPAAGDADKAAEPAGKPAADQKSSDKAADRPADKAAEKPAAKPAPKPPAPPTLVASIDLTRQQMTVTANGKRLYSWPISSGRAGYETPAGTFRPTRTEEMWYSTQYDDAPMPHSVFFNGGIATHATNATRRLGSPASHGCVRLAPRNAERFYDLVHQHGLRRTRIVVTGKAPVSDEPAVARRRARDRYVERYERDFDDDRPRGPRRRIYVDRYGYAPAPYYAPPPRLIFPGDGPRYRNGW